MAEDRVQEPEVVQNRLGCPAFVLLRVDKRFDLSNVDLLQWRVAKERDQVHAQRGLVVHQGCLLQPERTFVLEVAPASGSKIDAVAASDDSQRFCGDLLAERSFGLRACEAVRDA